MKKISCIIPAYNEAKGIGSVLACVTPLVGHALHEIIVIDDCSQDATKEIVRTFPEVKLIEHLKNGGKSKSVTDGILASTGDYIFLLDADLKFLNEQNIIDLIAPIENGATEVTISFRKNAWPLFPFKQIDYLSGERILPKSALVSSLETMASISGYGLEVFLNRIIISNHMKLAVVQWPNVENDFQHTKHGWWKGVKASIRIWRHVLHTVSLLEMYSQNIHLKRLLVRH